MATILEIARLANVSAENVLRVVNGEPVSSDVASRVAKTIEAVGSPPSPWSKADVVPAERSVGSEADELVSRLARTAAELEAHLPQVGSIVYEAVRVEVQPVSRHIAELNGLFGLLVARLEDMRDEIDRERRERLEDVALLSELVSAGWRSADRRLARLEQMLTRLEEKVDDRRGPRSSHFPSAASGGSTGLNNGP